MSAEDAIAGLGLLTNTIERNKERQFDLNKMMEENRVRQSEGALERVSAEKRAKIAVGPEYTRLAEAKRVELRAELGQKTEADRQRGTLEGKSDEGQARINLLASGNLSGAQAVAAMPAFGSTDYLSRVIGASATDPSLRPVVNDLIENKAVPLWKTDAYRKQLNDLTPTGQKTATHEFDVAPSISAVSELLKKYAPTFDQSKEDPNYTLMHWYTDPARKKEDPNYNMAAIQTKLDDELANSISSTDGVLGQDYTTAKRAASLLWKQVELGGLVNLRQPDKKAVYSSPSGDMQLLHPSTWFGGGGEGPPQPSSYSGYRKIPITVAEKQLFSAAGRQDAPTLLPDPGKVPQASNEPKRINDLGEMLLKK